MLWRAGGRLDSITLRADAKHLLTDVWTTGGVLVGVGLVGVTGWNILDPLIALAVAANILWTGWRLLHESGLGLLDTALIPAERQAITEALASFGERGITYHVLRTRQVGARRFVSLHVFVPEGWCVRRGHEACEEIARAVRDAMPSVAVTVFTHLESRENPSAYEDT